MAKNSDIRENPNEWLGLMYEQLKTDDVNWSPGVTSNWHLSDDQIIGRLGCKKKPIARSTTIAPSSYSNDWDTQERYYARDWRGYYRDQVNSNKVRTQDFTTTIKDQHVCPSCAAFAIAASMEANFQIQLNHNLRIKFPQYPGFIFRDVFKLLELVGDEIDLSEWFTYVNGFNRSVPLCSCDQSSWPDPYEGIDKISDVNGIAVPWEFMMRYPWPNPVWYANIDPDLTPPSQAEIDSIDYSIYSTPNRLFNDRALRKMLDLKIVKIPMGLSSFEVEESLVKNWLSFVGPVVSIMCVYGDFARAYTGGVYSHVVWSTSDPVLNTMMNERIGQHAICIVGYSDEHNCYICKNSWGQRWGDAGWFYIDYDDHVSEIGTSNSAFYTTLITQESIDSFIEGVRSAISNYIQRYGKFVLEDIRNL